MAISRFLDSSIQDGIPKYDSIWDGTTAVGSMEAISGIVLPSGVSGMYRIDFNNIPQTYSSLKLVLFGQTKYATAGFSGLNTYLNYDTTETNYWRHYLIGNGSTVAGGSGNNSAFGYLNGGNSLSKAYGICIIDILDYTNTNKYKTLRAISGSDNNDISSGYAIKNSMLWKNTAATNSITLVSYYEYGQYSSFSLYGIK
jgi:hypothetical protein